MNATFSLSFRLGLILLRWGKGPEVDFGHMPIKTPFLPLWAKDIVLATLPPNRGVGSAVVDPRALGARVGFAVACDLWGEPVARALQLAAKGAEPDTFAYPANWPDRKQLKVS